MQALRGLGVGQLRALAEALDAVFDVAFGSGTLDAGALTTRVPTGSAGGVHAALQGLAADGWRGPQVAVLLREMAAGREREAAITERYQLVLSPPEHDGVDARDTSAVIAGLFQKATTRLLIVTYVLDQEAACEKIFGHLAKRMDDGVGLQVDLVIHIGRPWKNGVLSDATDGEIIGQFAARFRDRLWPGEVLPDVYFDPRGLSEDSTKRATMHAKVVVVDGETAFLTSANFTEAAHDRNIEAGIVAKDRRLAARLERQFRILREQKKLQRLRFP